MAHRDGRRFDGQPPLSGHCGHGWTCGLSHPVAMTPVNCRAAPEKGLAQAQTQRDHYVVSAAGSHPDCRAVLIQIVALYCPDLPKVM